MTKNIETNMIRARLSASRSSTRPPWCGLNFRFDVTYLQIDFLFRPAAEQKDDYPGQDAEDPQHHQPEPGGIDALDEPAEAEAHRAIGLLGEQVGLGDEIDAVVGNERAVRQREE